MNKSIVMVMQLFMALFLLFFGMGVLIIGRNLYGSDASILWFGGFISYIAIKGTIGFIDYLFALGRKNDE